jgi:hypothetical protein
MHQMAVLRPEQRGRFAEIYRASGSALEIGSGDQLTAEAFEAVPHIAAPPAS